MSPPSPELAPAVETRALARTFKASRGGGEVVALAGVDVRIERGEIFGLLGPNGAGKTTFIKILTTLLFPTSGEAWVAGRDAVREPNEVRRRISLGSGGATRGFVADWVREKCGRTVMLTTHYMAGAEELCGRVAVIDRGRVLGCDRPAALRRNVQGGQHVELEVRSADGHDPDLSSLAGIQAAWGAPHPERGTRTLKFRLPPDRPLVDVLHHLEGQNLQVDGVATRETTLEDVFIAVVGR